ncbi:uncharacterized protein RHOBADRAFT_53478 [Rhodotorula graminis WP1]|uniref:Uncharacterized protein n=1 Tax=Rhodotorula graminis (strain WP1) TaxID=578459 RepID=A0A194S4J7_RHOGW|nr:uncharacterized protein RHOBADRAFT_53478 [Rhodotorula graminis WP1]KPV75507.1 hypothetical protein RHOBADRAFT_53478 [Rhodotorula graminis WP1]
MEPALAQIHALLGDFPAEQQSLQRALDLARTVDQAVSSAQPPSAHDQASAVQLLQRLSVLATPPASFCADEDDLDAPARLAQDAFRRHAPALLVLAHSLSTLLPVPDDRPSEADLALRAQAVLACGRFVHEDLSGGVSGPEAAASSAALVDRLVRQPPHVRLPLVRHLLSSSLPPLFKPHPKLNPATGRVLSRPLGGDRAMTDWFEESEDGATSWRWQAGLGSVVKLLIAALEPSEVEDLWPFLLPPVLTLLDDYEAKNKFVGVSILDKLLDKADASLLRRTGVGKVFEKSLENVFSALSDPLSPSLLAAAHPIALKLVNLQHPPLSSSSATSSDQPRFDALCSLLVASVAHTWEFKSGNVALEAVSCAALAPLVDALGPGSIRYLQLVVPHLCDVLTASNGVWSIESAHMLGAAAQALRSVVRNGRARIGGRWEGRVVAAVGQCWVEVSEDDAARKLRRASEGGRVALEELEEALRAVVRELGSSGLLKPSSSSSHVLQDPALLALFSPVAAS